MRIERVTAYAFGPFTGQVLEVGPGLTVVIGPNEAGKTSWHAAIRAALCGVRRGRGRATAADAAFEERHRPWDDPDRWEVEARLTLDDGRTIEITQDLAGKVACRATDVGLGRDVSDEIMNGTPDASRWLGLDRDAFAATVCVNQAQILSIADGGSAAALQEHMQRAAATRGTDATAAQARERLTAFRREHVGLDRVGSRGSLRAARQRLADVEAALADARRRHEEYLEASAAVERAERDASLAEERVRLVEAAVAANRASRAARPLARAEELAARRPSRPPDATEREADVSAVVSALDAWAGRPTVEPLAGPSSRDIEATLAGLPEEPAGDTAPHATVTAARRRLELAVESARLLGPRPEPEADPTAPPAAPGRGALAWAPALIAAALAGIVWVLGQPLLGGGLVVAAAGAVAWAWRATAARRTAVERKRLERSVAAEHARRRSAEWERRRAELKATAREAEHGLREALAGRGVVPSADPSVDAVAYEAACRERATASSLAGRRAGLLQALDAQRAAEAGLADRRAAVERAEAALEAAATAVGIDGSSMDPDALAARLAAWRAERAQEARRHDEALAEWQELTAILDGRSLDDLRAEAGQLEAVAGELRAAVGGADPSSLMAHDDLDGLLRLEREERDGARDRAANLAGGLRQVRGEIPDVAEAEEAVAEARAELGRVESLATVLDETLRLLRSAEERVHRDLAPILADGVRRWLPAVTGGAYLDASVDPANLAVQVKEAAGGRWRPALLLSQGTREQVYLLLRTAMAQSLVTTGETAPLLLDEVTAQADARRTEQLLIALHAIASERQVICFTHDERVGAWAERTLDEPRDRLVRLSGPARAAAGRSAGAVTSS